MKTSTSPKPFQSLQIALGITFTNSGLLENAFIHRSYLNEHKDFSGQSNERLEFLGDSVLSIIVSDFLFKNLPKSEEGELTQIRASLVRTETLAFVARKLNLGSYLLLSRGEEDSDGRNNKTILANTFEALVGAIYIDQGIGQAQNFIQKNILTSWKKLSTTAVVDFKSKLQEVLQRKYHQSPKYKLMSSYGPDHNRSFEIAVMLNETALGVGLGKNKQNAAQNAAERALKSLSVKK